MGSEFENMAVLPHARESEKFKEFQELFSQKASIFSDINDIFYKGKCPFFRKIEKYYSEEGKEFMKIYEHLQKLSLNITNIFPQKTIPFLKTLDKNAKYELTRKQVALLILLSFLNQIEDSRKNKNGFNVYRLLFSKSKSTFEFGRCFLNYLTVIGKWLEQGKEDILNEKILYIRDSIDSFEYKENKDIDLCELELHEEGSLFDGESEYCIDFANKYIGGGALTGGCVQEEILFAVEPEAVASMFFMEVMNKNDAIGIFNTIEYSKYTGYGYNFKYEKSAITDDLKNIKRHKIIAIDASNRASSYNHTYEQNLNRDIHKAYVGFNLINFETEKNTNKTIATGNWGCGAFGGNHESKFIEQWIAASFAGVKKLDYYTFNNLKMKGATKHYKEIQEKYKKAVSLYDEMLNIKFSFDEKIIKNLLK
jgi:poly(ADP-ribose) glycohydrolase